MYLRIHSINFSDSWLKCIKLIVFGFLVVCAFNWLILLKSQIQWSFIHPLSPLPCSILGWRIIWIMVWFCLCTKSNSFFSLWAWAYKCVRAYDKEKVNSSVWVNWFNLSFFFAFWSWSKANTEQLNGKLKISFGLHVTRKRRVVCKRTIEFVKMFVCHHWLGLKFKQEVTAATTTANPRIFKRLNASFTIQMANEFRTKCEIRTHNRSISTMCLCVRAPKRIYIMVKSFQCIFLWLSRTRKRSFIQYISLFPSDFFLFHADHWTGSLRLHD